MQKKKDYSCSFCGFYAERVLNYGTDCSRIELAISSCDRVVFCSRHILFYYEQIIGKGFADFAKQ